MSGKASAKVCSNDWCKHHESLTTLHWGTKLEPLVTNMSKAETKRKPVLQATVTFSW
jgi:hypothetical protein